MAAVFTGSFAAAALLHAHTVLALVLSFVAMTTLVGSVIGANVRSPRRAPGRGRIVNGQRPLPRGRTDRPPRR